ncbi:hypothetical protein CHS0354_009557 [Potamilus streckersoni]|uniref:Uncharacterized protein n=1 Tax=Potamilus streckersoni TaxID=2493646 RepID=A0AAE0SPT7_9BIVA|nr:hypothetical protein CHS0354_009557 [Potamilus streckersoni]
MAGIFIRMCSSMHQVPARVLCVLLVLVQGFILDYYLASHKNVYWYGWVAADIATGFIFFVAFVISYRHLILVKNSSRKDAPIQAGSLPLAYFAWFLYSTFLAARVAIIFKHFAWEFNEKEFFNANTLKINISLASLIFVLLLMSHHDAELDTRRRRYIEGLTATVVFDILDSVDVLDTLFEENSVQELPNFETAIISIACINFILPTLPLMILSRSHFGHKITPNDIEILHKLLLVFLVNLPLLVIRLILWHVLQEEISIFPMKNAIIIFVVFHDLYEKRRKELLEKDFDTSQSYVDDTDAHCQKCPLSEHSVRMSVSHPIEEEDAGAAKEM